MWKKEELNYGTLVSRVTSWSEIWARTGHLKRENPPWRRNTTAKKMTTRTAILLLARVHNGLVVTQWHVICGPPRFSDWRNGCHGSNGLSYSILAHLPRKHDVLSQILSKLDTATYRTLDSALASTWLDELDETIQTTKVLFCCVCKGIQWQKIHIVSTRHT